MVFPRELLAKVMEEIEMVLKILGTLGALVLWSAPALTHWDWTKQSHIIFFIAFIVTLIGIWVK